MPKFNQTNDVASHTEAYQNISPTKESEAFQIQGEGEVVINNTSTPTPSYSSEALPAPFDGEEVAPGIFYHRYTVEKGGMYAFSVFPAAHSIALFNIQDLSRIMGEGSRKLVNFLAPGSHLYVVRVKPGTTYTTSFLPA